MLFNSHEFILMFLPLVFILYFICSTLKYAQPRKLVLVGSSLFFAAYAGLNGAIVLIVSTILNYCTARWIQKSQVHKKTTLIVGLILNIGILCFFKYSSILSHWMSFDLRLMLPLGISFYTFQQIAFLVDTYRNETTPCGITDYFLFTSFFPKLVQGPILSYKSWSSNIRSAISEKINFENIASAFYLFAIGLSKKVLIADNFGKIVDFGYGHLSSLNQFEAVLTILGYTFQIYFDFSGYCDMACGIAKLFNIELPQNFNSPYKAKNISDFWKRWHMTLTSFLTHYIYFPLGGNRKGTARTYLNIMIVYLVSGLWHGTGLTFLIWGILHGIATILYRIVKKPYDKLPGLVQWILTFVFINITWIFFRAGSVSDAFELMKTAVGGAGGFTINAELTETLLQPTFISIASRLLTLPVVTVCGIILSLFIVLKLKNSTEQELTLKFNVRQLIWTFLLLFCSLLSVSGVSTFLYSNF